MIHLFRCIVNLLGLLEAYVLEFRLIVVKLPSNRLPEAFLVHY